MSLEVDPQSKPKCPLTLKLPSKSQLLARPSLESSSIPPTATSESFPPSTPLNVKFAPLPQLSPRKRRSSVPLGMAGREQLLSRRSGRKGGQAPPMWTDEGPEEYRLQQEELAARQARSTAYAAYAAARQEEEDEDDSESKYGRHKKKNGEQVDEDDRFLVLGRIVKGASKTLWKRVSNKDVAVAAAAATSIPKAKEDCNTTTRSWTTPTKAGSPRPLRPILGTVISNTKTDDHQREGEEEEEEGGVYQWEEEIGNTLLRNISQTETIVEGRVYSHFTSKVEALSRSPPPSPRRMIFMRPPKKLPRSK